jgi:hypothetical protein
MEFTTEEIRQIAEQMAKLCVGKLGTRKNGQIKVLEEGLRQGLKELGWMVLGRALSQVDQELDRELPCQCGGT